MRTQFNYISVSMFLCFIITLIHAIHYKWFSSSKKYFAIWFSSLQSSLSIEFIMYFISSSSSNSINYSTLQSKFSNYSAILQMQQFFPQMLFLSSILAAVLSRNMSWFQPSFTCSYHTKIGRQKLSSYFNMPLMKFSQL